MLKPLLACLILAAPSALVAAQPAAPGEWTVSGNGDGCILYGASAEGTVVSILAGQGQDSLIFLVQDKRWASLRDGAKHAVAVAFDDRGEWNFEAVAKTELDSDGPGLMFAVKPGEKAGVNFISQFAAASGMRINRDGQRLASLPVGDGNLAMSALAKCMGRMWAGDPAPAEEANPVLEAGSAAATPL
ncbi:MAG TPA: hypothetical protein VGW34_05015 [Allosphingosinicella sp.]|nr:hypothetical protein [Allosphingosinicella sp.]